MTLSLKKLMIFKLEEIKLILLTTFILIFIVLKFDISWWITTPPIMLIINNILYNNFKKGAK